MTDGASAPPRDLAEFTNSPLEFTDLSVSELVRQWASHRPDEPAYIGPNGRLSWAAYDRTADLIGTALSSLGDAVSAVTYLPDTGEFHASMVGAYRSGVRVAAAGSRSGTAELAHIVNRSGAGVFITKPSMRGRDVTDLLRELSEHGVRPDHLILVDGQTVSLDGMPVVDVGNGLAVNSFGVDDIWMLNSTSGTTGRPKLVTQTQRRWMTFAAIAARNAAIAPDEVLAAFVPAPFGFGLWTSHFLPALLGRPTLVMERFDAAQAIAMMRDYRATVLACVSTQFRMMLHSRDTPLASVTTLRIMYTGGEAVPVAEATEFETVTGARVLQFYGSNETGAASATTVYDDADTRLSTGGRLIDEMQVRVLPTANDPVQPGIRRGQPAVRGPLISPGYWDDDAANAELFTDDGWMLLGDVVEIDDTDRLRVVGRIADLIIRGGKNISAVEVEDFVREHPSVAMVAAVGVPDPIFGERLCAVVTLTPEADTLNLGELTSWLRDRGITREYLPERLLVVDEMPMAPGGKIAKARVKELAVASTDDADA